MRLWEIAIQSTSPALTELIRVLRDLLLGACLRAARKQGTYIWQVLKSGMALRLADSSRSVGSYRSGRSSLFVMKVQS